MTLRFGPDASVRMEGVAMKFNYGSISGRSQYRLRDADLRLHARRCHTVELRRADDVEAGSRVVAPILEAWEQDEVPDHTAVSGRQHRPREADELLARDHRHWRAIAKDDGSP